MKFNTVVSCFGFAFLSVLWVISTYILLPVFEGQKDYTLLILDKDFLLTSILGFSAAVFGVFAVTSIYYTNRGKGGWAFFTGYILLIVGLLTEVATLSWDLFLWPEIIKQSSMLQFIRDGILFQTPRGMSVLIIMAISILIGNLLFAANMIKKQIYPNQIGILLLIGTICYVAGNFIHVVLASIGLVIYSLAIWLIGVNELNKLKVK